MSFVIPAPDPVSIAVDGSDARFPVRRIYCVGRNYAEHAREMGHDPNAEPPFFFGKPASAVIATGSQIAYPLATSNLHHEAELVVALGKGGSFVPEDQALGLIWGYAAGNDLTRRDLQAEAKAARRPWDMSKGFDNSALVGPIRSAADWSPAGNRIRCLLDGVLTQDAALDAMIWPIASIIAYLSRLVNLQPGDLIFTGTPEGVGAIAQGQTCEVQVDGLSPAIVTVV